MYLKYCINDHQEVLRSVEYRTMVKTRNNISLSCFMNKEPVDVIIANRSVENLLMFSENSLNRFIITFIKEKKGVNIGQYYDADLQAITLHLCAMQLNAETNKRLIKGKENEEGVR